MKVKIFNEAQIDRRHILEIKKVFKKVIEKEYSKDSKELIKAIEVNVLLVNDGYIKMLNKEYRKKDVPTDVLSFPIFTYEELHENLENTVKMFKEINIGDIVISVERVIAQALEYEHTFERELYYMIVHGSFHLLGYDHMKKADKEIMRAKEESVLIEVKIDE